MGKISLTKPPAPAVKYFIAPQLWGGKGGRRELVSAGQGKAEAGFWGALGDFAGSQLRQKSLWEVLGLSRSPQDHGKGESGPGSTALPHSPEARAHLQPSAGSKEAADCSAPTARSTS